MYGACEYGSTPYGDLGQVSIAYTETFTDTITIDDPTAVELLFITYIKAFSDVFSILDGIFSKDIGRTFDGDTITPSDTIIKASVDNLTDEITITDLISSAITRIFSELITLSEDFFKSKALIKDDQIDMSDTYSRQLNLHQTFSDQEDMTDTLTNLKGKNLNDSYTITDSIRKFYNGFSTSWNKVAKAVSSLWTKQPKF